MERKHSTWKTCLPLLALALTLSPISATAQTTVVMSGEAISQQLDVGETLALSLLDQPPQTDFIATLRDEIGMTVATAQMTTDDFGNTDVTDLWVRTGVIGCETTALGLYEFASFDEAAVALAGRLFTIDIVDAAGMPVDSLALPLHYDFAQPPLRAYTSDAGGCFRSSFEPGESVFLRVENGSPGDALVALPALAPERGVFLSGEPYDLLGPVVPFTLDATGSATTPVPVTQTGVFELVMVTRPDQSAHAAYYPDLDLLDAARPTIVGCCGVAPPEPEPDPRPAEE